MARSPLFQSGRSEIESRQVNQFMGGTSQGETAGCNPVTRKGREVRFLYRPPIFSLHTAI